MPGQLEEQVQREVEANPIGFCQRTPSTSTCCLSEAECGRVSFYVWLPSTLLASLVFLCSCAQFLLFKVKQILLLKSSLGVC